MYTLLTNWNMRMKWLPQAPSGMAGVFGGGGGGGWGDTRRLSQGFIGSREP